jgi:hypothetical protein
VAAKSATKPVNPPGRSRERRYGGSTARKELLEHSHVGQVHVSVLIQVKDGGAIL